jgi:hypothetical protein
MLRIRDIVIKWDAVFGLSFSLSFRILCGIRLFSFGTLYPALLIIIIGIRAVIGIII